MYGTEDLTSAALCAWKEAREDGSSGMYAVLHCIKNRIGYVGFAKTLHGVIYDKNQFTSMSVPSDFEFNLDPEKTSGLDKVMWYESIRLASIVLNTDDADPTDGAHYYENAKTATSGWFQTTIVNDTINHPKTCKILSHTFYK